MADVRCEPDTSNEERVIATWTSSPELQQNTIETHERMAFLLALSKDLARVFSPQELVCTAMARLRERLGVACAALTEFDSRSGQAVILRDHAGTAGSRIEVATLPIEPYVDLVAPARRGMVTVLRNARAEVDSIEQHEEWYSPEGVGALISIPLLEGSELVASLSVVADQPRDWTLADIDLVREVATIVWPALGKARTERNVTLGEERLRLAQAVAQIGTWDWDPETRVVHFSQECMDLLGLENNRAAGQEAWQRNVDPLHMSAVLAKLDEVIACGNGEIEYRYRHPTRGTLWIYHKAGRVEHGGHKHVVGISLDVTARREAEESLHDVNRRKDEFLAMLAHELRNPLAPIRNAAQLLSTHGSGKPEIEWARAVIERQTSHLVRLVDDLLDVSRMVRGQITLQRDVITLSEIVQSAVEASRPLIRRRKHHLAVELPDRDIRLNADLTRLAQVLSNLLNNAAKYTDDGGHIQLDAREDGAFAIVRVRDTGLGIAPDLLPHVFDLFTQADRALDRAEGGLGIGLTLVKRIVEMHGGAVAAYSEGLGRGAEFVVRLPLADPALETENLVPKRVASRPEASQRSLRILIVDDNVDAADSVAMLLTMEGHQTRTVNTARAALLAAPEFQPEVVLLDIGLPEMDGYEVARRLRTQNGTHRIRLVAVTGYGQPADRQRAQDAGFDEHMVKPVEPMLLQDFLRQVQTEPPEDLPKV